MHGYSRHLDAPAGSVAHAVLFSRLEHDPSRAVRGAAARGLRLLAARPGVGAAFRAAAAQDEDVTVRWWARYALRLAADQAGPR
jgi:hypothetical protein